MKKTVKMVVYGAPGVGKSTFASKAPNPLFLTTDGNFEWLDLPEENNISLSSWEHAKKVFAELGTAKYDKYDTIVIDLVEDLYNWSEREFCKAHKIEHIGDYKSYGAGYSLVRDEFYSEISRVISLPKNVLLLSHELLKVEKDRKGSEHHKFYPSDKMSIDKLWTPIEGRVRYFLRAYLSSEEEEGKVIKKRYLSLVPKENEYGISRGLDESKVPEDIILDWDVFYNVIGLGDTEVQPEQVKPKATRKPRETKVETPKVEEPKPVVEEPKPVEEPKKDETEELTDVVNKLKEIVHPAQEEDDCPFDTEPVKETPKNPEPPKKTEPPKPTGDVEITEDILRECISKNMRINDIETAYGVKCSAKVKMAYIKIKNEMIK